MAFLGSGSAKLILFGEHAVVHGHSALGLGLPGQLSVRWTPGDSQLVLKCPEAYRQSIKVAFRHIARYFGLGAGFESAVTAEGDFSGELAGLGNSASSAWPEKTRVLPGGILEFQSDIPVSAGFGSSGAVCVAMAKALAAFADSDSSVETAASGTSADDGRPSVYTDASVWAAAHVGEQIFHGRPSGVDTGLALWNRLSLFTPQLAGLPTVSFLPGIGVWLVYGTVPREAACAANVAAIGKAMAAGDTRVSGALAKLGRLALQAAALFSPDTLARPYPLRAAGPASVRPPLAGMTHSSGLSTAEGSLPASNLGELANTAMSLLRELGLSTPAMDSILSVGLAAGATGGKLSGGGAGGAFWLACGTEAEIGRAHV